MWVSYLWLLKMVPVTDYKINICIRDFHEILLNIFLCHSLVSTLSIACLIFMNDYEPTMLLVA